MAGTYGDGDGGQQIATSIRHLLKRNRRRTHGFSPPTCQGESRYETRRWVVSTCSGLGRQSLGRRYMSRAESMKRFLEPSVTGYQALGLGILVVAIPTLIRAAVDGFVTGCEFSVYQPFVLVAAVFMHWRYAAAVALASIGVADYL